MMLMYQLFTKKASNAGLSFSYRRFGGYGGEVLLLFVE